MKKIIITRKHLPSDLKTINQTTNTKNTVFECCSLDCLSVIISKYGSWLCPKYSYIVMLLTIDVLSWLYLNIITIVEAKFTLHASEPKEEIYLAQQQVYNHANE